MTDARSSLRADAPRPTLSKPTRCTESCWKAQRCPECGNTMNPRGRYAPVEFACLREPCAADDPNVNPRHLWDANDDERWRFYPDERPVDDD